MGREPLISVVMCVWNGEKYIKQAIESVLCQSFVDLECIVVDDGSSDSSIEVARAVKDSRLKIISESHRGAAHSRNRGVTEARGRYISFLDADDYWAARKLEYQLQTLMEESAPDMVFTTVQSFWSPELTADDKKKLYSMSEVSAAPICGTLLMLREKFKSVGMFRSELKVGEFLDWLLRAKESGLTWKVLLETLYFRRIHLNNSSRLNQSSRSQYSEILAKSLARRRNRV